MTEYPQLRSHYRAIQRIAGGGAADIYKAFDPSVNQMVVLKTLKAEWMADPAYRQQLSHEAMIQGSIRDTGVVQVYDYLEEDGLVWLVEEFVPGLTLRDWLMRRKSIDLSEARSLCRGICRCAAAVHRADVVHLDLKPLNYLFAADGQLKLTDFGEARYTHPHQAFERDWQGDGCVSPLYMSPEQAAGLPCGMQSDVYSLGIMFYQILCGQLPFFSKEFEEMARLHCEEVPLPPRQIQVEIDPGMEELTLRMLKKNPTERPVDAIEVLKEIKS